MVKVQKNDRLNITITFLGTLFIFYPQNILFLMLQLRMQRLSLLTANVANIFTF